VQVLHLFLLFHYLFLYLFLLDIYLFLLALYLFLVVLYLFLLLLAGSSATLVLLWMVSKAKRSSLSYSYKTIGNDYNAFWKDTGY
jgi:hypothetical protein